MGLHGIGLGQHQRLRSGLGRRRRQGQHPLNRQQTTIKGQLANGPDPLQLLLGQLSTGHQQGQRQRQIKPSPMLGQISGSQVRHHPGLWDAKSAVAQRGTQPLPGFTATGIGQAHQLHQGQAGG